MKPLTQAEIDAVPELEGFTIAERENRFNSTMYVPEYRLDGATICDPETRMGHFITKLVRKLLSAEQEERLSGVWIDGRALLPPTKNIRGFWTCPFCKREIDGSCCPCGSERFDSTSSEVWIAPAPKEPEIVVEKLEGDYAVYSERNGWVIFGDGGAALAFDAIEKIPKEFGIYRVTRKGEQDGK